MMGAISGSISNDALLICLATWCLAISVYSAVEGWNAGSTVALALLTGAAMMTKTTAVVLLPTIFLTGLMSLSKKHGIKYALFAIVGAVAIAAPWWYRNQTLYGDPLALKAFKEAFVNTAQKSAFVGPNPDFNAELTYWTQWVGWWTARSFVGAFGYVDIWLNETGRAVSDTPNSLYRLVLAVFALGGIGWLISLFKMDAPGRKSSVILFVFGILVLAAFVQFNNTYFQAQGRYLLPAIAPIGAMVVVGWLQLTKQKWQIAIPIVSLVLIGINIYAIGRLPSEFAERKSPVTLSGAK